MKKIVPIISIIAFLTFGNIVAYGEESNQSIDRSQFINDYLIKMQTIVNLRIETETERNTNNEIVKQIKNLINDSNRVNIENKVNQIKQLHQTNRDLLDQAKTYASQRTDVRKQWQNALKDKDKSAKIKEQITELNKKIEEIKSNIKSNKELISPLIEEVKTYRDANKTKTEQIKSLIAQTTTVQNKIAEERIAKNDLWQDFSNYVTDKNYNQALITMDSIIAEKQVILSDIKSKNSILNEILTTQRNK